MPLLGLGTSNRRAKKRSEKFPFIYLRIITESSIKEDTKLPFSEKIMVEISRSSIRLIRDQVDKCLSQLEKLTGLTAVLGDRVTFDPGRNVTFKLTLAVKGETPEVRDFELACHRYGLKSDDLGKTFISRGKTYKITGLTTRRPKFPINVECSDGKAFKFPAADVVRGLGRAVPPPDMSLGVFY